jgi:thiol-disulfide isomerase/thioredoxin
MSILIATVTAGGGHIAAADAPEETWRAFPGNSRNKFVRHLKQFMLPRILTTLTGVALAVTALTAEARLTIGDPAPKLQVAKWVQGDPVKAFDTNHVYIVEFWATWYPPCRAAIPHLNELHEKFKDRGLITIGQDIWEDDNSGVAAFVKKMGGQMTYRVALDDRSRDTNGIMAVTWMKEADQISIPTAFVINRKGRIVWIGHPTSLDEQTLEGILADIFDSGDFAAEYERERVLQMQRDALYKNLRDALLKKNWDAADAAVAKLEKTVPDQTRFTFGNTRLQILLGRKNYTDAYKLAKFLSDTHLDKATMQNSLAWTIATQPGLEKRDLALAEKIAMRANEAAQGKEPTILVTLARIQFMNGKKTEAIATEQKAVNAAANEVEKNALEKMLADYQQGKLPEIKQ